MSYHFFKMHGCGNDFLFVDAMDSKAPVLNKKTVQAICDRHFGIGADGVAVFERGTQSDAKWTFYNCDGSEAEMCGNAARCATLFLSDRYFPEKDRVSLETAVGIIQGKKLDNDLVEVSLNVKAGTNAEYEEKILKFEEKPLRIYSVNTGVPHAVIEVEAIETYPIGRVGNFLVKHPTFGEAGTNVTFFQKLKPNEILCTTFERGVECETYACGTGVSAGSIVYAQLYAQPYPIKVKVPGGILEVDKAEDPDAILLRGPAAYVMELDWLGDDPKNYEGRNLYGKEVPK